MINHSKRYQTGLTLNKLYPSLGEFCACGCDRILPKNRKKWATDNCRNNSFVNFAIIKGDISIIRHQLYLRDMGACHHCGEITANWEADHIIPVAKGGAALPLSNFQTLCSPCHKEKSYNLSHHSAISSQAASILFIRNLYPVGQHCNFLPNTSNDIHSLGFTTVSLSLKYLIEKS